MTKGKRHFFPLLFVFFFVVMAFAHSQRLEDMDLAPRLFFLAVFNIICLSACLFILKNNFFEILSSFKTPVFLSGVIFTLSIFAGYFKSINNGDALFEVLKITTALSFLVTILLLLVYKKIELKDMALGSLVATCITIAYTSWNIYTEYQYAVLRKENFSITYTIFGNHCNKNTLAEFLLLCLPLNAFVFLKEIKWLKVAATVAIIFSVLLIAILKSASVLITLVVGIMVIGLIVIIKKYTPSKKKVWLLVASMSFMLITIGVANKTINSRISLFYFYTIGKSDGLGVNNNNSTFERLILWRNSLQMIKESPVTGTGLSNWKILFPKYGYSGAKYLLADTIKFTRAHNDYLQFWAENGILSFISFIAIFFFALRICFQKIFGKQNQNTGVYLICLGGVLSYALLCLFSYTTERPFNLVMLMLYLALIIAISSRNKSDTNNFNLYFKVVLCLLIGVNFYATSVFAQRIKNELLLHNTLSAQKLKSYKLMLSNVQKIDSENFPISYTATPINWYKASAYFLNDKTETAKDFYLKALQEAPYHVQVISDAGVVLEKGGDLLQAESFYKRALSINKDFPQGKLNLSALKYNQGKITEAYDALKNFAPKSVSKTSYEKMVDFKKTFLVMLADSALNQMKQAGAPTPSKEKIFYKDLLKADSISEKNGAPIRENLIQVFSFIK